MRPTDDETARHMIAILGDSLDQQLVNTEYLASRGYVNQERSLTLLRRAVELRDADGAA